jgi:hypothetical protein
VYEASPGSQIYRLICNNCHGPLADAHGRLADNLLVMTGGNATVANLRDGLFGPVSQPGANRTAAFGTLPSTIDVGSWATVSVDDRAARYTAWMANGGTEVNIPLPILQIVSNTSALGVTRVVPTEQISANMLSVAKAVCYSVLFSGPSSGPWFQPDSTGVHEKDNSLLITSNGDAEMWLRLCSAGNPPPVRAVRGSLDHSNPDDIDLGATSETPERIYSTDLFPQEKFGNASPVGNHQGTIDSCLAVPGTTGCAVPANNLRPYCFRSSSAGPGEVPLCPLNIDNPTADPNDTGVLNGLKIDGSEEPNCTNGCWGPNEADRWATRGAINAGFAVFLYLDQLTKGVVPRLPDYDQCEQLTAADGGTP